MDLHVLGGGAQRPRAGVNLKAAHALAAAVAFDGARQGLGVRAGRDDTSRRAASTDRDGVGGQQAGDRRRRSTNLERDVLDRAALTEVFPAQPPRVDVVGGAWPVRRDRNPVRDQRPADRYASNVVSLSERGHRSDVVEIRAQLLGRQVANEPGVRRILVRVLADRVAHLLDGDA